MSIQSIESQTRYAEELDKLFTQKSVTGFFEDNAFAAKFVGAKTVMIPDVEFQGLADYDRENGFLKSSIKVSNTPYNLSMDRARSIHIDSQDLDESGIASLAGKVLGEYVRTKVVPECDAYVLSKLITIANTQGNTIIPSNEKKPFEVLNELIANVRNAVGIDEELVAFVNMTQYAKMLSSDEIGKMIIASEFKKGDIKLDVNTFNGVPLIPVMNNLMRSEFRFKNTPDGGFDTLGGINALAIVCPKKAVHLVKKTEKLRVFTPEQNIEADAYRFDYRIYYDAFVKKSELSSIWAAVTGRVEIRMLMTDLYIAPNSQLGVETQIIVDEKADHTYKYQWYYSENPNLTAPVKVTEGEFDKSEYLFDMINPNDSFKRYYFLRVYIDDTTFVDSHPCYVSFNC